MSMEQKDIAGLVERLRKAAESTKELVGIGPRGPEYRRDTPANAKLLNEAASALTELSSTLAQREARVKELEGALEAAADMMEAAGAGKTGKMLKALDRLAAARRNFEHGKSR